jgi:hypothetical protein
VIPIGGEVRQLRVEPDPTRMAQIGVSLTQIEQALEGFSANAGGGFIDRHSREYLIRHIGRTNRVEDLQQVAVAWKDGRPVLLHQVADVRFAAALKRGDAGYQRQAGGDCQRAKAAGGRYRRHHASDRSGAGRTQSRVCRRACPRRRCCFARPTSSMPPSAT